MRRSGSTDEPLWTPGTAPAGIDDLFTGSSTVLPVVSPGEGVGVGGCLTSPGLGLGMADYFQVPRVIDTLAGLYFAGLCLAGLGRGCAGLANVRSRYCQGGVVPASSHSHAEKDGEVDMLRADVKDSAWSAADVASMMVCSTPGQVSAPV